MASKMDCPELITCITDSLCDLGNEADALEILDKFDQFLDFVMAKATEAKII